ncbi:MAG: TetR/AcrR family transcriptional regulator [Bacteroidota bacterium]
MSPRTTEQFDEIRQRSRQRIMDAALALFGSIGYQTTSISKIAKAAGISKGLMYNYFASKQELLEAIIIAEAEEGAKWWHEILERNVSPLEKIRQVTQKAAQEVRADIHHWRLLTSLAFQPEVLKNIEALIMEKKAPLIQESIELFAAVGVVDPEREAFYYGALLDGMFLHYITTGDAYPLDEMIEYSLQRYERFAQ